jgi:hypothetical protein
MVINGLFTRQQLDPLFGDRKYTVWLNKTEALIFDFLENVQRKSIREFEKNRNRWPKLGKIASGK